jgi:formate--tetrahydrofolate ligase
VVLVHGGPFANIAHGCNSIFATKTAMNLAEYTLTEAGFGSDLGGEKFFDIVCQNAKLTPNAVVLVVSIRSLKSHGGATNLSNEDMPALIKGFENLDQHINNVKNFQTPLIVAINSFKSDTPTERKALEQYLIKHNIPYSFTTLFEQGSKGALKLAKLVVDACKSKNNFKPIYNINEKLKDKITKIAKLCYGADAVVYSELAKTKLQKFNKKKTYICMAKTPLTFSDDPKQIVIKKPFTIHVNDLIEVNGANFIVVMAGNIFRMPGLPKEPNACNM